MSDQQLDRLFAAYREALPDPEPSAAFMPGLWTAIEAQRTFRARFRKLSRVFVTAAGALWLAMATILIVDSAMTQNHKAPDIDLLADSHASDPIALAVSTSGSDRK